MPKKSKKIIENSLEEIKTEKFIVDWKEFFTNNEDEIRKIQKQYYFKNQVTEKDIILWGCQAVFWGRRARKFKVNPNKIYEDNSVIEVNQTRQDIKPPHSSNWDL